MSDPTAIVGTPDGAIGRARAASRLLDEAVRIPGTDHTVGLDALISLVPISGDALGGVLSLYVVLEAINLRAPPLLVARMLLNVAVDAFGGSIPVLGVLIDALWRANTRNRRHLERHAGVSVSS